MRKGRTRPSTPLMVLALIHDKGRAMSTYEMSLHVGDNRENPRPLSVIVRSLSRDGYLESHAKHGRRTSLWRLTEQGEQSVIKRSKEVSNALRIIQREPCMTDQEKSVMRCLKRHPSSVCEIAAKTKLPSGKVRTALKRLLIRENILLRDDGTYDIAP